MCFRGLTDNMHDIHKLVKNVLCIKTNPSTFSEGRFIYEKLLVKD